MALALTLAALAACARPAPPPVIAYLPAGATPTAAQPSQMPTPVAVTATAGVVQVSTAGLADGRARFYSYQDGARSIPFFVLQTADGSMRVALDACDVCFPARLGYRQEGDELVCNNCGSRFAPDMIGVETGGCNPAPLPFELGEGAIIIRSSDLLAGARYF